MGAEARAKATELTAAQQAMQERLKAAIPYARHQLIDAYARPVEVGGVYAFSHPHPIPGSVVDVAPILEPNAPPGSYMVTLMIQVPIRAMSRSPIRNLVLIERAPKIEDLGKPIATVEAGSDLTSTPAAPDALQGGVIQLTD